MADIHVRVAVCGIVSHDRIPLIFNPGNVLHRELRDGLTDVRERHEQGIVCGEGLLVLLNPASDFNHGDHPKFRASNFRDSSWGLGP